MIKGNVLIIIERKIVFICKIEFGKNWNIIDFLLIKI